MTKIDSLVALMKKIFPNEDCNRDNISEYLGRLAIKDVSRSNDAPQEEDVPLAKDTPQGDDRFAQIQMRQTNRRSRYASERITPKPPAKARQTEPYATFRRMRQIGGHHERYASYYASDAKLFYKQAVFMKNFADNYGEIVPLDTYYATYGKMNDAQLRTYFTWRTKARKGIIEKTSISYVFCYIFELINDVGARSPADAIEKLIALWTAFRPFDDKLDDYLRPWIRDYYVAHKAKLPAEFSEYSRRFPIPYHDYDIKLLEKAKSCDWDDLRVIEASSSFKITNGQFYKSGNRQTIEKCACFTIRELAKVFKSGEVDFRKMFFENRREKIYSLYQGAVHRGVAASPTTVELDAFETIKYSNRGWHREYVSITQYRPVIGYILKLIEINMRRHFGYKRNLQAPNLSAVENGFLSSEPERFGWQNRSSLDGLKPWKKKAVDIIGSDDFEEAISRAICDYCKSEHIIVKGGEVKVVEPIEIDLRKLEEIERQHMETAQKLIMEEPPLTQPNLPILPKAMASAAGSFVPASGDSAAGAAEDLDSAASLVPDTASYALEASAGPETRGMSGFYASLGPEGKKLLSAIIGGGQAPPNSELLIEEINEKALEAIDDNLIDWAGGAPYVYEDYIEDLKSSLEGDK